MERDTNLGILAGICLIAGVAAVDKTYSFLAPKVGHVLTEVGQALEKKYPRREEPTEDPYAERDLSSSLAILPPRNGVAGGNGLGQNSYDPIGKRPKDKFRR